MSESEDRLRQAFEARAAQVDVDRAAAWRAVNSGTAMSGRRRARLAFIAVGLVTVVAATGALVLVRGRPNAVRPAESPTEPPTGKPTSDGAVTPGAPPGFAAIDSRGRLVLHDLSGPGSTVYPTDGKVLAIATITRGYVYAEALPGECASRISLLTFPDRHAKTDVLVPRTGEVRAIAVTRDGARLAYSSRPPAHTGGCGAATLHVRGVTGGDERVWSARNVEARGQLRTFLEPLAWAADGQELLYTVDMCCGFRRLDTRAAGDDYLAPELVGDGPRPGSSCVLTSASPRDRTTVTAVRSCNGQRYDVVEIDPDTGSVRATLFSVTQPGITVPERVEWSADGSHALISYVRPDSPGMVAVWDGRQLRVVGDGLSKAAW
jgi:hypothetical protein